MGRFRACRSRLVCVSAVATVLIVGARHLLMSAPAYRVAQLQRIIRLHKPGETVTVDEMRYGQKHTYKVKLAEAPNDQQVASADDENGGDSADAKAGELHKLEFRGADDDGPCEPCKGLRCAARARGRERGCAWPSYQKLFAESDVIVKVLNPMPHPVRTVSDLDSSISKLKAGDVVSLLVYNTQQKGTRVVNLRIGG